MSRKLYFGLLAAILAIFMPVQMSIGRSQPPATARLEDRLAWIDRTAQYQAWGVVILMSSVLLLVVAYHVTNRRKSNLATGP